MPTKTERWEWVDAAKGIGIILVVIGHAERGLVRPGVLSDDGWRAAVDAWIYSFHMPMFFWLSGLFAANRLRDPWGKFLGSRFRTILYPYLLWATLQTSLQILLAGSTNSEASVSDLWRIPYHPPMQYWFLLTLFWVACVYQALRLAVGDPWRALLGCVVLYAACGLLPTPLLDPVRNLFPHLLYYSTGAAMAQRVLAPSSHSGGLGIAAAAGCFLAVSAGVLVADDRLELPLAAAGVTGTVLVCQSISHPKGLRALQALGAASLQIYVAHTLASAGFRIVLLRLGISDATLHLVGGIAVGIAFPLLLDKLSRKWRMPYMFSLRAQRE